MSRVIWSRAEPEREDAWNEGTVCWPAPAFLASLASGPRPTFEGLFREHYGALRPLLQEHRRPGLAVLVATRERLEATAWFEARTNDVHPLVLGRHNACDLFLSGDEGLSLRHLALVLHGLPSDGAPPRYRVCDLRTPAAFSDEHGRRLESVEAAGPLALHCASFSILLFPTPAGEAAWPEEPSAGWQHVPERIWLEPSEAVEAQQSGRGRGGDGHEQTLAFTSPGPRVLSAAPDPCDPATGELRIATRAGEAAIPVGPRLARRGLLVGRYQRCDPAPLQLLGGELSRVHLLVVELDGELHAIDTCSRNGSSVAGRAVRCVPLRPGVEVVLARETRVSWHPHH